MKARLIIISLICLAAWFGLQQEPNQESTQVSENINPLTPSETSSTNKKNTSSILPKQNEPPLNSTEELIEDRILEGDQILSFKSKKAYLKFLDQMNRLGIKVTDTLPSLRSLRVSFKNAQSLRDFLKANPSISLVSENSNADIPEPLVQSPGKGLRDNPLAALGISDNQSWGKGISVAVLDTGVMPHSALKGDIQHIDLVNDGSEILSSHGTSVASLIAGQGETVKGIAPQTDIIDIRVLNNEGSGDVFTIAKGIIAAADNQADIINLSLGTDAHSPILEAAVQYAQERGSIIVAAVGNNSAGQISYPAKYPGVIAVAATDANQNYASFSNRGIEIDISAPGVEVIAATNNDQASYVTGTSFSAPIIAGSIAAEISNNPSLESQQVINNIYDSADDGGFPGLDPLYGHGTINLGRLENNLSSENHIDLAASGFHVSLNPETNDYQLYFSGENRGNTTQSPSITLQFADHQETFYYKDVAPSQSFYEIIKVEPNSDLINQSQNITIIVNGDPSDSNPSNNSKTVYLKARTSTD
jgi:subtilisin family serine protease